MGYYYLSCSEKSLQYVKLKNSKAMNKNKGVDEAKRL